MFVNISSLSIQNDKALACNDEIDKSKPISKLRNRKDFLFLEELGEGSFSSVYLVVENETKRKFAAKVCYKTQILREKKVKEIFREKEILQLLSTPKNHHLFIVQLFCTFQDQDSLYFILTLASKKDLLKRLKKEKNRRFSIEQSRFIASELLSALAHIHNLKIVHRDLKLENLLLSENGHILLSDFGCAKILNQIETESLKEKNIKTLKRKSSFVGTSFYVSPEVLNGDEVDETCDFWTFGVILYEILGGRRPFSDVSEYLTYQRILKLLYKFDDDFPNESNVQDLIKKLLVLDPKERFGSKNLGGNDAIKNHEFFSLVTDWENLAEISSPLL